MPKAAFQSCKACGGKFIPRRRTLFCSDECRKIKSPAVYRFVSSDGRSYVGSRYDIRNRAEEGIRRTNSRLASALDLYPAELWSFEILERLPPGCSETQLRHAEQKHIEGCRSFLPEFGFNVHPAIWAGDGAAQHTGREFRR